MATTARLDLRVWRNDDVYEHQLRVRGMDLSTLALRMQVRLGPDIPGAPLIDLGKVANGNAQGLRVAGVAVEDGLPVTDLRIRINKSTLQAMPYSGEIGDATTLSYALQISGKTRVVGRLGILAHAIDSDAAPASRPAALGGLRDALPEAGATLTIAGTQVTEVSIGGADLVAPLVDKAGGHADAAAQQNALAGAAAERAEASEAAASIAASSALAVSNLYPSQAAGLAATPEGSYFAVAGAGDATATIFRKVGGAAVSVTTFPSAAFVAKSADLAAYLADMRTTLERPMRAVRGIASTAFRTIASDVINGAFGQSTDAAKAPYWAPDKADFYGAGWIRDVTYAAAFAPEFFPVDQLAQFFAWYAGKSNTAGRAWQVPDHIYADGTVRWTPGDFTIDPPDKWGERAPTDGETSLIWLAWQHFRRTGRPTLFNDWRVLLRGLLDNAPMDATTKCLFVPENYIYVTDGFIDTIRLVGSVSFGTILFYQAWRQYADMAFAAGDQAEAVRAIARAEEIKVGLNTHLWATIGNSGSPLGLFRASNGALSPGVWDVAASALAVYTGAATDEHADAISDKLAVAFTGNMVDGKPNLFARGGIRRVLRENDYSPGTQVWQTEIFGVAQIAYDDYQSGGVWPFYTPWVIHALARRHPDLATAMARAVLTEFGRESRVVPDALFPEVYNVAKGNNRPGGYGPIEPTSETYNQYRVKEYVVSAAAIAAIDHGPLDPLTPMSTTLVPKPGQDGAQTFLNGQIARMAVETVSMRDELGGADAQFSRFRAPLTGVYAVKAIDRFGTPASLPTGAFMQVYVNDQPIEPLDTRTFTVPTEAAAAGYMPSLRLNGGDLVDVRVLALGGNLTRQNLPGYTAVTLTLLGA